MTLAGNFFFVAGTSDQSCAWRYRLLKYLSMDPVLPLSTGRAERHGFEYYRHGTLSLYAALNTGSGEVIGQTSARHTSTEFVAFLEDLVARQPQQQSVHIICDNLSAHKTKAVCDFLARHPKVRILGRFLR
jgi:hypothetical protein